jgi:hypothetical protein
VVINTLTRGSFSDIYTKYFLKLFIGLSIRVQERLEIATSKKHSMTNEVIGLWIVPGFKKWIESGNAVSSPLIHLSNQGIKL